MSSLVLITALVLFAAAAFYMGRGRALATAAGNNRRLHSLPGYYGWYAALWCGVPAFLIAALWLLAQPVVIDHLVIGSLPPSVQQLPPAQLGLFMNDVRNLAEGDIVSTTDEPLVAAAAAHMNELARIGHMALALVALAVALGGAAHARRRIAPAFRARNTVERAINLFLVIGSTIAILTTIGIVLSLLFEALRFFAKVSPFEFLFGLDWSPQTALRRDQVASSGLFGAVPLFAGTLLITGIAMVVAVPIGLMSAIYLAEYAPRRVRDVVKPVLEILAGIPTVVYGFFAALTVAPFIRDAGAAVGLDVASESALAAGLVMGIMIIPFVSSLSDDVINAVPQTLRDGSYALGATQSETIRQVIVPAALPGIVGGVMLAVSRAIGETMIVVMAAGLAANLTLNPLDAVTTVTVQIVTLLVGDQEFDSAKTLAAFALGLTLFCVTLALNVVALGTVRKYREKYE